MLRRLWSWCIIFQSSILRWFFFHILCFKLKRCLNDWIWTHSYKFSKFSFSFLMIHLSYNVHSSSQAYPLSWNFFKYFFISLGLLLENLNYFISEPSLLLLINNSKIKSFFRFLFKSQWLQEEGIFHMTNNWFWICLMSPNFDEKFYQWSFK